MMFAQVILPLALPKNYTYSIPEEWESKILPGMRVEVVLGKNKKYAGIVRNVQQEKPGEFESKPILNILDSEPVVNQDQLDLWAWIADYYMCTEGEVMAAALPSNFKLSSETMLVFNEEYGDDFSLLNDHEFMVAEALLLKKELKLQEVQQILDSAHVYPVVKKLIEAKVCWAWEALKEKYTEKKENYVFLADIYKDEKQLEALLNGKFSAPKQLELLMAFLHLQKTENTEVKQSELIKKSGASAAQLKGLSDKGILVIKKLAVDRIQYAAKDVQIDFELSTAQEEAFLNIKSCLADKQVCLLHGVTSSGKTQIYIRLIEEQIKAGHQVLYLLPEIALTSQVIRRLQKHFGGYIGIYHSKFNPNERVEIWNKVKSGDLRVVLGARSSIFLPFADLGLVIIDEEHDPSFKQQEPAPRYNARDTAIFYASRLGAKVLLGSATPSMETYANVRTGKYGLVELFERFGNVLLPEIEMVDTRLVERKGKEKLMISPQLQTEIEEAVKHKKQVILFQNRRGYSPYMICGTCGFIPHCEQCDVTLTFHKIYQKLQCHYCGNQYAPIITCPACGKVHWQEKNFGTEKIEEQLAELFPEFRIARMDIDTVRGKHAHDQLIQNFEQHRIDILVGTQMVVKGLDFDHVHLVGILDADGLLSFADFRVNERAFQLMEQVSGRAGRKDQRGKVLIQTTNPKHPVLGWVQLHDYKQLYQAEAEARQQFNYPPFSKMVQITFKHRLKHIAEAAANIMGGALHQAFPDQVSGPAEPVIGRIRNMYIMELLLRIPKTGKSFALAKTIIKQQMDLLQYDKTFRSVIIHPDVDPQ
ncbi:MAG: primosomal protein N' [Sphingobacteriales bacterium]|jgi:primosomal protein N' (replication factor Y)